MSARCSGRGPLLRTDESHPTRTAGDGRLAAVGWCRRCRGTASGPGGRPESKRGHAPRSLGALTATQALDWLSILMYEREDRATRRAEDRARKHRRAAQDLGVALPQGVRRGRWRSVLAARRRFPRVGVGAGLAFGAAFVLLIDELAVPALQLTPGPLAFSWKVHARGAASHLAYGVAAESVSRAISGAVTLRAERVATCRTRLGRPARSPRRSGAGRRRRSRQGTPAR